MALPSFDKAWRERQLIEPRILVLEIRDKKSALKSRRLVGSSSSEKKRMYAILSMVKSARRQFACRIKESRQGTCPTRVAMANLTAVTRVV